MKLPRIVAKLPEFQQLACAVQVPVTAPAAPA